MGRANFARAGLAGGLLRLIGLPRSAWGLFLGHLGLAAVVAGVAAISVWQVERIVVQKPGESAIIGGYDFRLVGVDATRGPNYQSSVATVLVTRNGEEIARLTPERRWHPAELTVRRGETPSC